MFLVFASSAPLITLHGLVYSGHRRYESFEVDVGVTVE